MPRAQINGIELYYEVHGDGPETVVFAHGAGGNHLSWWQQVPVFARRYRCVTFDHRAFGWSRDAIDGPGRSAFVDDFCALLDHLKLERIYLVAQSMGGQCAMGFTLRHPDRVKALVMASTVVGMRHATYRSLDAETNRRLREARERYMLSRNGTRALGRTAQTADPTRAFLYREIAGLNPPRDPSFLDNNRERDVTPEMLAQLRVPVLFLAGEEDEIYPPIVMQAAQRLIPGARLVVVPEAGHSVYFEKPEAFNSIVLSFFADVAGA